MGTVLLFQLVGGESFRHSPRTIDDTKTITVVTREISRLSQTLEDSIVYKRAPYFTQHIRNMAAEGQ